MNRRSYVGSANPNWKGGRFCGKCQRPLTGYKSQICFDCYNKRRYKGGFHVNPWGYARDNKTKRFVHVLVMEKKLGRKINSTIEKVHHINHDKLDNSPENLQLMSISEHNKLHKTGGDHWKNRKRINGKFA
jgi:hypothetical protein